MKINWWDVLRLLKAIWNWFFFFFLINWNLVWWYQKTILRNRFLWDVEIIWEDFDNVEERKSGDCPMYTIVKYRGIFLNMFSLPTSTMVYHPCPTLFGSQPLAMVPPRRGFYNSNLLATSLCTLWPRSYSCLLIRPRTNYQDWASNLTNRWLWDDPNLTKS